MSSISGSVGGLATGLDVDSIVKQLVQVESRPKLLLQARRDGFEKSAAALADIRAKIVSLRLKAADLASPAGWERLAATSSNPDAASVTATSGAVTGAITFRINQLATSRTIASDTTFGLDTVIVPEVGGSRTISVTAGGQTRSIDVGAGTLGAVVNAINESGSGVTATAVRVADGQYRLQIMGPEGAAGNDLAVDPAQFSGLGGWLDVVPTGQDAELQVGSGAGAYTITSATNTFTEVLPGVTITARQAGQEVTVRSSRDGSALADKVEDLVKALNEALTEIAEKTKVTTTGTTSSRSPLTGDSRVRQTQQALLDAVVGSAASGGGLVGVTITREGRVSFDRAKFLAAYTDDPVAARAAFVDGTTPGVAARVRDAAQQATDPTSGLLTVARDGISATIRDMDARLAGWEQRLAQRERMLRRQFSALESAIGGLRNQSNWLAGQLAGMYASSS